MRAIIVLLLLLVQAAPAQAVTCDGTELLCLDLTSPGEVTANGGTVVGGSFSAAGFAPANQGGIDFDFPTSVSLSDGAIEFDIEGLQPLPGGELDGGKVSLFSVCGVAPDDNEYIGFQKMSPDYRDGHVFRYGQDDDGLADNWDSVVITSSEFGCAYNIQNWTAGQTHHIYAEWDPSGLYVEIDGSPPCTNMGSGNGDAFDPLEKFLVIGNRCEHLGNQQPLASIRNLRLWGGEAVIVGDDDDDATEPPCSGPIIASGGISPEGGAGSAVTFQARYRHCLGAETFRVVQLMVAEEVTAVDPNVHVSFEGELLRHAGQYCAPGDDTLIESEWGALDCAASGAWFAGNELVVDFALILDPDGFAGPKNLFFDAKGGEGDPEPRLGWTHVGTWTVEEDPIEPDGGDHSDDDDSLGDEEGLEDDEEGEPWPPTEANDDTDPVEGSVFGCHAGCGLGSGGSGPGLLLVLLAGLARRRQSMTRLRPPPLASSSF